MILLFTALVLRIPN